MGAGFDEARPVSGQALAHTLDQHAANLGSLGQESTPNAKPFSRVGDITAWDRPKNKLYNTRYLITELDYNFSLRKLKDLTGC
jgi:hypothetical protein